MSTIALFGAAGPVGRSIAAALSAEGRAYRVVGRSAASLHQHFGADPLAEIVTWNPDQPVSVQAAASGIDTLIYLVGVPYGQFALHPELMRKTLAGALAAGVNNLLLIGTVYPYGRVTGQPLREDHPRQPHTFKGRMRKQQEDLVMQAHAEGRIQATVLRLADFYGPGVETSCTARPWRPCRAAAPICWDRSTAPTSLSSYPMSDRWSPSWSIRRPPMATSGIWPVPASPRSARW